MHPIDSTSRFLAQIAEQVSSIARTSPAAKKIKDNSTAPAKKNSPTPRDVNTLVAQRVMAISPDDPRRRRKAFRIFLESVLANEFGSELINDPAFHAMIDNVQMTMEKNAELLPAIERAGEFLLASANKPNK